MGELKARSAPPARDVQLQRDKRALVAVLKRPDGAVVVVVQAEDGQRRELVVLPDGVLLSPRCSSDGRCRSC